MGSIFRILSITALVLSLGSAFAGPAAAIPGVADCPDGKKEIYVIPYARSIANECETFVQCQNLDRKDASITVQFYFANPPSIQVGVDATDIAIAGEAEQFASDTPDPSGRIFTLLAGVVSADTDRFCRKFQM